MSIHRSTLGSLVMAGLASSLLLACATAAPMQPAPKAPDPDLTASMDEVHAEPVRSSQEPDLIYVHTNAKRSPQGDMQAPEVAPQNLVVHQRASN